jgi:glycosyltransferase involved in cell wall biosynthesis
MASEISAACDIPVERFHVTPDALDTAWFAPSAMRKAASNEITIVFVGRLERQKGIETLVQAIPRVLSRINNAHFVIVGGNRPHPDGKTYLDYAQAQLADYLALGQVEFTGFVSDEELVKLYHRADLTVVPSLLYESFSFTCAQAMACGVPVIASCIGGIPETLAHGECGVLIDPGDAQALVEAIVSLARNPRRREQLSEAGRKHAVAHFSAEVVTRQILESYENAL